MKKLIALVLALVCVLGLVGCNVKTTSTAPSADAHIEETTNEIQPDGTPVEEAFDITVSHANWAAVNDIYAGALNADKMMISSVQHLPIYKFDTLEEFQRFKSAYDSSNLEMEGYTPSFNDTTAEYDEAFFEENTLMLVFVGASSGTYRFGVNSVFCDGTSLCIHIEQSNNPEDVTDDMAGWFITVAVPDSMVENCMEFDADLNNFD